MTLENAVKKWFSDAYRIVIIGIGNPLRSDDGAGMKTIQMLQNKVSESVYLIESETVPENFMQQIVDFKPTHILMIDAALLKLEPGSMKFATSIETGGTSISTHFLPIKLFWEYILETANAKIGILLIQPKNIDFGEELSTEVKSALDRLIEVFLSIPAIKS